MSTILYRATVLDSPSGGLGDARLRSLEDAGLLVRGGVIIARGPFSEVSAAPEARDAVVVDHRDGLLLPGFVDTHVHFPQLRVIGGIGQPLLQWLSGRALPEETRLADPAYAAAVATEFLDGLVAAGTTSALVFGAHQAEATDELLRQADRRGLRMTAGLVVSDRGLHEDLHTDPETAYAAGLALAQRWHGGRRYAVTPRFSLSASEPVLGSCRALLEAVDGAFFTSHVNENPGEVAAVAELFPTARDYTDTYERHGLLGPRSVLAHSVHTTDPELERMAATGTAVAHCPTSNAALGSGMFPMARHLGAGVRVGLGSDVGGGTGLSLLKEGLQAYFTQQQLGQAGQSLAAADLLALATRAGAEVLGLDAVGHLSVGMQFDAVLLRPAPRTPLAAGLRHAADADDAVAKLFALGTPADVAGVWVGGDEVTIAPHAASVGAMVPQTVT